ncbi:hypothetical protein N599_33965 [Saccharopolyspora erythraea D]|nr:hypothetical protein N599_33965 [Saccharopolyspora erythraea D]
MRRSYRSKATRWSPPASASTVASTYAHTTAKPVPWPPDAAP